MVDFDINLEFIFLCWLALLAYFCHAHEDYILTYFDTLTQLYGVSLYFLANQPI